jgi:hypothetical protein
VTNGPQIQVFAVRRALVTSLQARAGLAGALVTYGWPGAAAVQRLMVFTDSDADGQQQAAAMRVGRLPIEERAELDVTVRAEAVGGNQLDADTAIEALLLELEQAVVDDRTLGGLVSWIKPVRWTNRSAFNDRGYLALVTFTYQYQARLI